jgi:prepilin-type N-terminal cleavage/methylation domain-containing protein
MRRVKNAINRGLRSTNGFSLVEIIAVLAIIAILATAVLTVGRYAIKRGRIGKAKATLNKLSLVIGLYKEDFGVYIPESIRTENGQSLSRVLDRLQWPSDYTDALGRKRSKPALNDYDKPSEILFFFLQEMYDVMNFNSASRQANKGLLASLPRTKAYVKFKKNELADTDGRVDNPQSRHGPPEIVDGWGMPFLYVAADRLKGDTALNIEPHEGKNRRSFSLYCFGPDKLGYYDAKERGEQDYPVGDLNLDGQSNSNDDTEMQNRITRFAQQEGYSSDKATKMVNKDNVTNWQREGP